MRKAIAILILSGIVFIASACGAASGQADEGTESFIEAESPEKEETDAGEISAVPEASADRNEVSDSQSAEVPEPEPEAETAKLENLDGLEAGTVLDAAQLDLTDPARYFTGTAIAEGDPVYERINGRSYRDNPHIGLEELRYLKMLHYNFDGQIQVGEMIVNESIQEDVLEIFQALFREEYEIQSMYLIDDYWTGDAEDSDTESVDANNTSAFCYREITGGGNMSNHAYGLAIDLNPQQNPYVSYRTGEPVWWHENANDYIDRDAGLPHMITHEDLAYELFTQHGFEWGGDWDSPKDYQHFEKN